MKKGWLKETSESVGVAIHGIQECFTILFPGVEGPNISDSPFPSDASRSGENSSHRDDDGRECDDLDWSTIQWVTDEEENTEAEDFEYEGISSTHTLPFTIVRD